MTIQIRDFIIKLAEEHGASSEQMKVRSKIPKPEIEEISFDNDANHPMVMKYAHLYGCSNEKFAEYFKLPPRDDAAAIDWQMAPKKFEQSGLSFKDWEAEVCSYLLLFHFRFFNTTTG